MPYTLSGPQAALYTHQMKVYRATPTLSVAGKLTGKTGAQVASLWENATSNIMPCYFQPGQSFHGPQAGVLAEQENMLTTDTVHVHSDEDLQSGDVLLQTTGPDSGKYFEVRGQPQKRTLLAFKQAAPVTRLEKKPAWVTV